MTKLAYSAWLFILPILAFGQLPQYLDNFKNTWNTNDPVDVAYLRGIHLIQQQSDARNETDIQLRSTSWAWNENTKTWRLSNRIINTYNPEHHLIGDIGQQWIDDAWVDQYRTTYVYNEQGLIRLFQYEAWTGANWELYVRFVHEYDANDRLQYFTAQDWMTDKWVNRYQRVFEYNLYPCYHRETRLYWIEDAWQNGFRYTDFFDEEYLMTTNTMQHWSDDQWQWSQRNVLEYDSHSSPVEIRAQQYHNQQWQDITSIILGYDASGLLTSETYHNLQNPNATDNGWTFQYDENKNLVERDYWKECEPYWQASSRDVFDYDNYHRNTSILHQDFTDYWLNRSFTEYEYLRVTGVSSVDLSAELHVYPNPAHDYLNINLPDQLQGEGTVLISSVAGKKEWQATMLFEKSISLPINYLSPGIYVIRLHGNAANVARLFVKG